MSSHHSFYRSPDGFPMPSSFLRTLLYAIVATDIPRFPKPAHRAIRRATTADCGGLTLRAAVEAPFSIGDGIGHFRMIFPRFGCTPQASAPNRRCQDWRQTKATVSTLLLRLIAVPHVQIAFSPQAEDEICLRLAHTGISALLPYGEAVDRMGAPSDFAVDPLDPVVDVDAQLVF